MVRPKQYAEHRFIGDKRTQLVYDLDDDTTDETKIVELVESEQVTTFGPDTLAEARNRGYRICRSPMGSAMHAAADFMSGTAAASPAESGG